MWICIAGAENACTERCIFSWLISFMCFYRKGLKLFADRQYKNDRRSIVAIYSQNKLYAVPRHVNRNGFCYYSLSVYRHSLDICLLILLWLKYSNVCFKKISLS